MHQGYPMNGTTSPHRQSFCTGATDFPGVHEMPTYPTDNVGAGLAADWSPHLAPIRNVSHSTLQMRCLAVAARLWDINLLGDIVFCRDHSG